MSDGEKAMIDYVNHPPHYQSRSGVECIDVIEDMPYNLASAVKYVWRIGKKWDDLEDLEKAIWFLKREKERRLDARKNLHRNRAASSTATAPSCSEGETWCRLFAKRASDS